MQLALAAGTFMAAVGATYFFCVRPMRQGRHCAMSPPTDTNVTASHNTTGATAEDLQAARTELAALVAAMAASDNGTTTENASAPARGHTPGAGSAVSGHLDGAA
jgi:hypothetical protein